MGAAQGGLAGAEIVEQGSCALHLWEVEFVLAYWTQVARLMRLNDVTGEFHDFLCGQGFRILTANAISVLSVNACLQFNYREGSGRDLVLSVNA